MSGVDTVRGIAFQHAHAVLAALDVLDDDALGSVRVEGTDDILDIEVFGADESLRTGKQVKTRRPEYSWGRAELSEVFARWAALPGAASASFEFITDGRLGPTGQQFADSLGSAASGEMADLAALVGEDEQSEMCRILARASVHVDAAGLEALIDRAERQVRSMLPSPRTAADAHDEAERAVEHLAITMLGRAGDPDPGKRLFTRAEIAKILGVPADQPADSRWPGQLRDSYLSAGASLALGRFADSLIGARAPGMPQIRRADGSDAPRPVTGLLRETGAAVLAGRTGMGKSTAAELLRRDGARQGQVVLVAPAEAYIPGCLPTLVADAISEVVGEDLPAATGRQALADRDVTLVIDGVSEVPAEIREGLREELRAPQAAGRGSRFILLGRDLPAVRSVLPDSRPPALYGLVELDSERRLDLACRVLSGTGADDPANAGQLNGVRGAIARAEHALGDAAGNPLLLTMALNLIRQGTGFTDRVGLYRGFINLLAQRSGTAGIEEASAALGIAYAALLDQGRRYAKPIEWAMLLKDAAAQLAAMGVQADARVLDATARRCGLIIPVGTRQTLFPLHDSFADFLAGTAHAERLAPLPQQAVPGDRQRLLFAAEIGGTGPELTSLVTRDLPFLTVQMAAWDRRSLTEAAPNDLRDILQNLDGGRDYGIGLWRTGDGRAVAFRTGHGWRWVDAGEADGLLSEVPWVAVDHPQLLKVATRIWRQSLVLQLKLRQALSAQQPRTQDEARDLLEEHVRLAAQATRDLVADIAPPGHAATLQAQIGPLGLKAIIQAPQQVFGTLVWPVSYQKADTIDVSKAGDGNPVPPTGGMSTDWGSASLDHLIRSGPQADAIRRVRTAIEEMTIKGWLTP